MQLRKPHHICGLLFLQAVYSFPPIPPYTPSIADLFWVVAGNLLMDGYDKHETTHINVYIKNEAVKNVCTYKTKIHPHTNTQPSDTLYLHDVCDVNVTETHT